MKIKKRYMQRNNWSRCLQKKFLSKQIIINNEKAILGLLIIEKVVEPLVVNYEFKSKVIASNNYKWLQIAIENKNFWITAMYDDKDNLIQIYIDITKSNCFKDVSNPFFYDLFLDIVILPNRKLYVLDEIELTQALKEQIITQEDYELAHKIKDKLILYLKHSSNKLISFCNANFIELISKM